MPSLWMSRAATAVLQPEFQSYRWLRVTNYCVYVLQGRRTRPPQGARLINFTTFAHFASRRALAGGSSGGPMSGRSFPFMSKVLHVTRQKSSRKWLEVAYYH